MGYTIVLDNKLSPVAQLKIMQYHISKCFNKMAIICPKSQYAKHPVGWCWRAHNKNVLWCYQQ